MSEASTIVLNEKEKAFVERSIRDGKRLLLAMPNDWDLQRALAAITTAHGYLEKKAAQIEDDLRKGGNL